MYSSALPQADPVWHLHASGSTIGRPGSEQGIVLLDEEHDRGARITLERGGDTAPFSITGAIYGRFTQTAYADNESEGRRKYVELRHLLEQIIGCDRAETPAHEAPALATTI